jgi:hypothetical protein
MRVCCVCGAAKIPQGYQNGKRAANNPGCWLYKGKGFEKGETFRKA